MNPVLLLGTVGAGVGLAAGLAFNLRLARALGSPLAASLVNFGVGAAVLFCLWLLGVDGARPAAFPAAWMLLGGLCGATYVTLTLAGAARLGVGLSTVAVALGQVLGALFTGAAGVLGQASRRPTLAEVLSAALLVTAVALLGRDRERAAARPRVERDGTGVGTANSVDVCGPSPANARKASRSETAGDPTCCTAAPGEP